MKYIKTFNLTSDYEAYMSGDPVLPNVSYLINSDVVKYNPKITNDFVIMTSTSNPRVMEICYNQGWAASPDQMLASEAAKVTDIGTAFQYTDSGTHPIVNEENSEITSFNEFQYFINISQIKSNAFCGTPLTSIIIPESVTSIDSYALAHCHNLSEITCNATTAPTISGYSTFSSTGSWVSHETPKVLKVPTGSDYSTWLEKLGSGWTIEYI